MTDQKQDDDLLALAAKAEAAATEQPKEIKPEAPPSTSLTVAPAETKELAPKQELDPFKQKLSEFWRIADAFVAAGLVPDGFLVKRNDKGIEVKSWENGFVDAKATTSRLFIAIMKGDEIGLSPVTAVQNIMVVNNRPTLWGDALVGICLKSGKVEYMRDMAEGLWADGTYNHTYEIKRRDQSEPFTRSFSQKDAKDAGLLTKKGPWTSGYGPRMCFQRARAWALRDAFSDMLMGLGVTEELQDMAPEKPETKTDTSSLED